MKRRDSGLTVTDQFCGAGGSTIGAKRAGLIVLEAQNHWRRAVETYSHNHPNTRVHCADVSNTDPRRCASTDLLITSPECTTHSPAGGNRPRYSPQRDVFMPDAMDPAFERSRATMRDVPRFAEYHEYPAIIVENVVEAVRWPLFGHWLTEMTLLDYRFRVVSFNSMFAHPTPQSRDRIYIVFWKKRNRAPDLEITRRGPCPKCERDVEAIQTWKRQALERGKQVIYGTVGKYRQQYTYTCSHCTTIVTPYFYAAMNAIDFRVPGQRIGDRKTPLRPRTMERIQYGLDTYGKRVLVVQSSFTKSNGSGTRPATREMPTHTTNQDVGIVTPFVVRMRGTDDRYNRTSAKPSDTEVLPSLVANGASCALVSPETISMLVETRHADNGAARRVRDMARDPMGSQTAQNGVGVVTASPGFAFPAGSNPGPAKELGSDVLPALTCTDRLAIALGPAFVGLLRSHNKPTELAAALSTITSGGNHHLLVHGSAVISMRDAAAMRVSDLSQELATQATAPQQALMSVGSAPFVWNEASKATDIAAPLRTVPTHEQTGLVAALPFIVNYQGQRDATEMNEALRTLTTSRLAGMVIDQAVDINDCYFRMLMAHEIGAGMAFPSDYVVLGNNGEKIKQFGNAVTPPVQDMLCQRVAASLAPELEDAA